MKTQVVALGKSTRGLLSIMLAAVLWGTVGVAVKVIYGLAATNALSIGFLRLAISVPALFVACWYLLGWQMFQVAKSDLLLMLLMGVMTALYQVCYFGAIAKVGIAIAVLLTLCLAPIIVALFSLWLLGEKLTPSLITALSFALTGTVLLVGVSANQAIASFNTLTGVFLALAAAFGSAIVILCCRALAGRYHPLQSLTIGFSTGAVILLPFALLNGLAIHYPVMGWALLLYLGLVPTVLAYLLFLSAIRQTTATVASITTLLEPLTSTILAWLFFHEQLSLFGLWGGLLLLGAMLLLLRNGREKP
jgi:drug/metabolite transporter, DME family